MPYCKYKDPPAQANSAARYAYFDKVQVWLKQPLDAVGLKRLRRGCRGEVHVKDDVLYTKSGAYRQRLQLHQLTRSALVALRRRNDVLINMVEIACDYIYDDEIALDTAADYIKDHLVQRHHRTQVTVRYKGTLYTGQRRAKNRMAVYADRHCKLTGEVHCLHIEWRVVGVKAVRAAGVHDVGDLLGFNHHAFWQNHLCLYEVDVRRLGRGYWNSRLTQRRRNPWTIRSRGGFVYDHDRAAGSILFNNRDRLVQKVVDTLGPRFNVRRYLRPLDPSPFLPDKGDTSL